MLNTKEFYDVIAQFERTLKYGRFDKEPREMWARKIVYQDGKINEIFQVFLHGYQFGRSI